MTSNGGHAQLTLRLTGNFCAVLSDGTDVTPRGAKARGILAMIATGKDMKRSRVLLQETFWSDRGRDQANNSLRQALTEIRRAFGDFASVIKSKQGHVLLDKAAVLVDMAPENGPFLEDIVIPDPAFEHWVQDQRGHAKNPGGSLENGYYIADRSEEEGLSVFLTVTNGYDDPLFHIADSFIEVFRSSLSDMFSGTVFLIKPPAQRRVAAHVRLSVFRIDQSAIGMRAILECPSTGQLLLTRMVHIPLNGAVPIEDLEVLHLVNEVMEAIGDWVARPSKKHNDKVLAKGMFWLGLRKLFSMQPEMADDAEAYFLQAYQYDPQSLYLAWQANLNAIRLVERGRGDLVAFREKGQSLLSKIDLYRVDNAATFAALANAKFQLNRDELAFNEFAQASVDLNPSYAFGLATRSSSFLYAGDLRSALKLARNARTIVRRSPMKFWWEMNLGLTEILNGNTELGLDLVSRAHVLSPRFKPPLRVLVALHALHGNFEMARQFADRLKAIEPDFEPLRLAVDPSYPFSLLRKTGHADEAMLKQLR